MKRWIISLLLFVAVFAVTWLCLPYTFICLEYESFNNVLFQFFREPLYGALIVALAVTLVYLLLSFVLPKKAWIPVAFGIAVAAVLVVFSPGVRRTERWSRVKRDAIYGVWDDLLQTATPAVCEKDPEMTPFALLALSGKGQLGDKMFTYPVFEENDLDMVLYDGKTEYYNSLLFKYCLYQYLGCYNEAIHNLFQWATQLKDGMGYVVLRRLTELYYLQGNYVLMEKYCRVLDQSLFHGAFVRHFRALAAKGTPQEPTPADVRAQIPVIGHDPMYNLLLLESNGIHSPLSGDRLLATLLLRRQREAFLQAVQNFMQEEERLPRHFQEAMLFWGARPANPDQAVLDRYQAFCQDVMALPDDVLIDRYKDTAFLYLSQEE